MDDLDNENETPQEQPQESSVIKDLRKQAAEGAAAKKELETLKRTAALRDSMDSLGLAKEDRARFEKLTVALDVDVSNSEAVRSVAEEYRFLTHDAQAQQAAQTSQEIQQVAQGGETVVPSSTAEINRSIANATTREEVIELSRKAGLPVKGYPL